MPGTIVPVRASGNGCAVSQLGWKVQRIIRAAQVPLLMLSVLSFMFRRLMSGRVLAGGDLHLYFYPYWIEVARALQNGRLPLWNPYLFAGVPLLANSQVGVLYPLNWPFWLLFPASPGPMATAIHWSVVLHVALAAVNVYILLRRRKLGRWAAALAGVVYAGSGFVGVHTEHLNQLQALSWLPLLFLPDWESRPARELGRSAELLRLPHPTSIAALAMILLAGHTQMAFIAIVGLSVWHLVRWTPLGPRRSTRSGTVWLRSCPTYPLSLVPFALAGVIAAAQLLPSLELVRYSGRSGGLDWREAVSFSVPPWQIPRALLPPYLSSPLLPEGVGTVGLLALLASAVGAWRVLVSRSREGWQWLALGFVGLLGALGGYNPLYLLLVRLGVPGFVHFRAPARFLALYVFASAVLTAYACEWVAGKVRGSPVGRKRTIYMMSLVLFALGIAAELSLSAEYLPAANATIMRAYTDLRPATADLVAGAKGASVIADGYDDVGTTGEMPGRFLSISEALFEVGDKAEIEIAYGGELSPGGLWAYLVSSKYREILAPNLSLVHQVQAVDGYDGGLLPMRHYIAFTELLMSGGTADGRLRENLIEIPEQRWLDLLGVAYLVTDKTTDAWIDDVLFDRQFQPVLEVGDVLAVAWLPQGFAADTLIFLYEGSGTVRVDLADGRALDFQLPSSLSSDQGYRVTWDDPAIVSGIALYATGSRLHLGAGSLVDSRMGTFYPFVLSDVFRLVHSGDVKIYEKAAPDVGARRAFLVHETCTADAASALTLMRDPDFDPVRTAVLITDDAVTNGGCNATGAPVEAAGEWVRVSGSSENEVVIDLQVLSPGYLVVADAWYPGWSAAIRKLDSPTEVKYEDVVQADLLFRAVPVDAGRWRITLSYSSWGLAWGTAASVVGVLLLWQYARTRRRCCEV